MKLLKTRALIKERIGFCKTALSKITDVEQKRKFLRSLLYWEKLDDALDSKPEKDYLNLLRKITIDLTLEFNKKQLNSIIKTFEKAKWRQKQLYEPVLHMTPGEWLDYEIQHEKVVTIFRETINELNSCLNEMKKFEKRLTSNDKRQTSNV